MADEEKPSTPEGRGEKPDYKVYRSRPRLLRGRAEDDGLAGLRAPDAPPPQARHDPEKRGRGLRMPSLPKRGPRAPAEPGRRRRITAGRVLKWLAIGLAAWVGVSALL